MFIFNPTKIRKKTYADQEIGVSKFIPYLCHWNNNTILTKKKSLMRVIKVKGFSFETADDEDLDIKKNIRNMLFKALSSGSICLYFHTVRRKVDLYQNNKQKSKDYFSSYIQSQWHTKYSNHKAFTNDLYITIIKEVDTEGAAIFEYFYKKFIAKTNKTSWQNNMIDMYDELEELTNRVMSSLAQYNPQLLGVIETPDGIFCQINKFLGSIINCGFEQPMLLPKITLDKYLNTHRLFFGNKAIEARGPLNSNYAGIVSIKEYGPTSYAGAFDSFLKMPFEFIMTQSFKFANRQVAISKMQLQQNRMVQAEDKAVSQIAEISKALDMAMSGDIAFGNHHLSIMVIADTPKHLEHYLSMASVEMFNAGLQPVREKINLECAYWGQLPDNNEYIVRNATINSLNLAGYVSLHNYPSGKAHSNHWGESVAVFDTTSGTPFHFNFHIRDVGHTLIIGPTGAGKTVLMNFLCAMAQKFNPRMYFFDKDRGAEIFIRAINGNYTVLDPGSNCNFNPLQLVDNAENRAFLLDWLKILVTTNGESLSAEDITTLSQTIEGNFKLDKQDRVLRNIVPFMGIGGPGSLANRIAMWHSNGSRSSIFDNDQDKLDLTHFNNFGFEMAELLKDPIALGPVLSYIFHRINISLDGQPTMIVLDEAWALIDNPIFAPKIKDWLKVLRKLNAFVIFATQSVEDASNSQISNTLIQQTATQIFLPNLKATSVYKTSFMLSEREYQLIKTTDPSTRYFLIKQGSDAVVARIDLRGMNNIINVLSSRINTVLLLEKIIKKYGDDPKIWLPIFYEEAAKED